MSGSETVEATPAGMTRSELVKRFGLLGLGFVAAPSFLAACGGSSGSDGDIKSLTWGLGTSVRSLDIAKGFDESSLTAMMATVEPLLTYSNDLKLTPVLAESWSQPDALTYRYKIRKDVKFWDGTDLTVDDVVFSLSRHLKPTSEVSSLFAAVKSIEADGDDVVVNLKTASTLFQYVPTAVPIYSKAFAEKNAKTFGGPSKSASVLGTGPYKETEFRADDGISYERNDDYWGDKALSETLELKFIEDPQTRQLALQSGDIDGAFNVPLESADSWGRGDEIDVIFAPGLRVIFLTFDVTAEPWSDIHVRKAFAHAIDKKGLVSAAIRGHGKAANALVPPEQWSTLLDPDEITKLYEELPDYEFDLAKAKAEMAKSATPDGFTVSVPFPLSFPEIGKALLAIAENVKPLGIELKVVEQSQTVWIADILKHKDLKLHGMGLAPDEPDPANYLVTVLPSANATENALNMANYKNPKVDALLDKQNAATSAEERVADLKEILRIIATDLPYLPLFWEDAAMAVRKPVAFEGFTGFWTEQQWYKNVKQS
jgi:peptide/nickel transport system substrate-binding protein